MTHIDYNDEGFPEGHMDHPYIGESQEVISMLEQAEQECS